MPTLQTRPPDGAGGYNIPLIRVPVGRQLTGMINCHRPLGLPTHWYGGRTVPCTTPNCPACQEGLPWRWHAYVPLLLAPSRAHVLLELTAQAVQPLIDWADTHDSARGVIARFNRAGPHKNARVITTLSPGDPQRVNLPDPPNVAAILATIWGLPTSAVISPDSGLRRPTLRVVPDREPPSAPPSRIADVLSALTSPPAGDHPNDHS